MGLVKEDLGLYSKGKKKNFHRGMTELDLSFTEIVILALLFRRIQSLSSTMRVWLISKGASWGKYWGIFFLISPSWVLVPRKVSDITNIVNSQFFSDLGIISI